MPDFDVARRPGEHVAAAWTFLGVYDSGFTQFAQDGVKKFLGNIAGLGYGERLHFLARL